MKRKIIEIDEEKCDGCGQCVRACHEGALALIDGKARLVTDSFCDGLGACIGDCPRDALRIVEREAPDFDAAAVAAAAARGQAPAAAPKASGGVGPHAHAGCPGKAARRLDPAAPAAAPSGDQPPPSSLGHWPVQLTLVPPHAPFLQGADLLVCADCVPFAVPDFHARYLAGRAVVVGCPKLDDLDRHADKLRAIVEQARPRRITVLRMEVPCCGGLVHAVKHATRGCDVPVDVHVVGMRGGIERSALGGPGKPHGPAGG